MATTTSTAGKPKNDDQRRPGETPTSEAAVMQSEIDQLKADIAILREQLARTGQHSYRAARRAANDGMEQLRARGEEAVAHARASAQDIEDQLTERVREKPMTSLAIAAAVGFLFALFARR